MSCETETRKNSPKIPGFFDAKFPGKFEEKSTKVFWSAGQVTILSEVSVSIENCSPEVSICGALVVYSKRPDRKIHSTIDRSKVSSPEDAIDFFHSEQHWAIQVTRAVTHAKEGGT